MGDKKEGVIFLILVIVFSFVIILVNAENDVMKVEATFVGYGDRISLSVPDYVYLGQITTSRPWNETRVDVENTGSVDAIVTPQLVNESENVFSNLYFRTRKSSSNDSLNELKKIGDYDLFLAGKDSEYFYMSLNMTDYEGSLGSGNTNYSAEVRFLAMPA